MTSKTLEQLENDIWSEPPNCSNLVKTCHQLRKKPIAEFEIEDLRIMIGQRIGLLRLMPVAIERLEHEPMAAGDFYPGDLLSYVIGCRDWLNSRPDLLHRVHGVAERALSELSEEDEELRTQLREFLSIE